MPRCLVPLVLAALVAGACSSDGPTLVATDEAATPVEDDAAAAGGDSDDGAANHGGEVLTSGDTEATPTPTADAASGDDTAADPDNRDPDNATPPPSDPDDPDPADAAPPPSDPDSRDTTLRGCTTDRAGTPTNELSQTIDFDRDGAPDQFFTYAAAGGDRPAWRLRVETAGGAALDSALDVDRGLAGVAEPLGSADIDGDGDTDELLTVVGAGASARLIAIHARQGCELVQATVDGFPITFPIGGSIGNKAGLECIDADNDGSIDSFVAWVGVADFDNDLGDYFIDGVEYQLRDGVLQQIGTRTLAANVREADFVYGQLSCGDVNA